MAFNRFIRPVSSQYHDFTQQSFIQPQNDIPLKFRQPKQHQQYIPKPSRIKPQPIQPIIIRKDPQPQGCCGGFQICGAEICGQCADKLCKQCKTGCFTKITMCQKCKSQLCRRCRSKLWQCNKGFQLRSYPIKIKRINQYHFSSCKCHRCLNEN